MAASKTSLSNKTILITGASSGIGTACAYKLAEAGAKLVLVARRAEILHAIAADLQQRFQTRCHCIAADVSQRQEITHQLLHLPEPFHEIDILINNAGLAHGLNPIQEGNLDEWDHMIDVNIKGLLYVTHAILPQMIKRNSGHIVNLGSMAGYEIYPNGNIYGSTKAAVAALNKSLRLDLCGMNIRVTEIDPGVVHTDFILKRFKGDQQRADTTVQGFKALSAEDIADTIHYAVTCPPHVNIEKIMLTATMQASTTMIKRD